MFSCIKDGGAQANQISEEISGWLNWQCQLGWNYTKGERLHYQIYHKSCTWFSFHLILQGPVEYLWCILYLCRYKKTPEGGIVSLGVFHGQDRSKDFYVWSVGTSRYKVMWDVNKLSIIWYSETQLYGWLLSLMTSVMRYSNIFRDHDPSLHRSEGCRSPSRLLTPPESAKKCANICCWQLMLRNISSTNFLHILLSIITLTVCKCRL